jgi:hypothetical protein
MQPMKVKRWKETCAITLGKPRNRFLLWKLIVCSAGEEVPRLLRNQILYHVSMNPPQTVFILSQMNPVHALQLFPSPEISFNTGLPSVRMSSEKCFTFRHQNQNCVCTSNFPDACYMPCLRIPLDLIILIFCEEHKLWRSPLGNCLHSSLIGPHAPLSTLPHTPSTCASSLTPDRDSHPYTATVNSIVLYVLIFTLSVSRWGDERFRTAR